MDAVLIELDPVDRITTDAVGSPGSRVFYIQARKGDQVITLLVEKQQVQLLAAGVVEILARVGKETGEGPPEEQMALEEPIVPEWRAGRLSIGYHEERDLLVLEAEEQDAEGAEPDADELMRGGVEGGPEARSLEAIGPELEVAGLEEIEEELEEEAASLEEEPDELIDHEGGDRGRARFWATREQMLSLARHGATVCAAGRPVCTLCRNPIDPEGHQCLAMNGHRELRQA